MATSSSSPVGNGINFICFVFYGGGNDGNVETSMLSHEGPAENGLTTGYESSEVSSFLLNAIESKWDGWWMAKRDKRAAKQKSGDDGWTGLRTRKGRQESLTRYLYISDLNYTQRVIGGVT